MRACACVRACEGVGGSMRACVHVQVGVCVGRQGVGVTSKNFFHLGLTKCRKVSMMVLNRSGTPHDHREKETPK